MSGRKFCVTWGSGGGPTQSLRAAAAQDLRALSSGGVRQVERRLQSQRHMSALAQDVTPTLSQIQRYDAPSPRYTSYPTAPEWREDFGPDDLAARLRKAAATPEAPLSLYVHLPFCQELCTYCGCNVVVTRDPGKADRYLDHVDQELALLRGHLLDRRGLHQLHLGGGTPTFLSEAQLARLHQAITDRFALRSDAEAAVEIDPVVTTPGQLRLLRSLGYNRLSLGVQDFDPAVQRAVRRIQSVEATREMLELARDLGFSGVNFDMIYGLPFQTEESWGRTIDQILALRPDRLAIYSFAYVPAVRPHQRRLPLNALPQGAEKMALILLAYRALTAAGYRAIGMDHFALPEDELARAQERRTLFRNFQGYTARPPGDVIAAGVTGISDVQGAFAQNTRPLSAYYEAISAGRLATERGLALSPDDVLRRGLINQIMCNFFADLGPGGAAAFAPELARLAPLIDDGMVGLREVDGHLHLEVLPRGRFFVRNVATAFDAYLQRSERRPFSRSV